MSAAFDAWLQETRAWTAAELRRLSPAVAPGAGRLEPALRYALFGPGKRFRPTLVRLVCQGLGGSDELAAPGAVAIELVHTYSLVHDDLPCMDDDEMRRGRATVHVAFDEATAVLVGDALLTGAFEVLARHGGARAAELVRVLALAAGAAGMVAGQAIDLSLRLSGDSHADASAVEALHGLKTAALFAAAAEMGAIAAGRGAEQADCARAFGSELGRLFQAVDDLLDARGDAATLGKTPGKDAALARATLVTALGEVGAEERARAWEARARRSLDLLGLANVHLARELVARVRERRA
jgi:geranylgeranyl pyrophosphate synthase